MGHTSMYLSLRMQLQDIAIAKVASHRMFLLHVHLTCSFSMFFLAGKVVQVMAMYLTMHIGSHLLSYLAHTYWLMLGFQLAMHL